MQIAHNRKIATDTNGSLDIRLGYGKMKGEKDHEQRRDTKRVLAG